MSNAKIVAKIRAFRAAHPEMGPDEVIKNIDLTSTTYNNKVKPMSNPPTHSQLCRLVRMSFMGGHDGV